MNNEKIVDSSVDSSLVLFGYYEKIFIHINNAVFALLHKQDILLIKNGYIYNDSEEIFIGQKIKCDFDDTFYNYTLDMYVVDILVNDKDDFGIIVVPVNYKKMFGQKISPILKEVGVENQDLPRDGCFFAKHIGHGRFEFDLEERHFNIFGCDTNFVVPKLFSLPKQTFERIKIYSNLRKLKLPTALKRIMFIF